MFQVPIDLSEENGNNLSFNTKYGSKIPDLIFFEPGTYATNIGKFREVGAPGGGDLCMKKESALNFCILMYSLFANYQGQGNIHILWVGVAYCQELRMLFKFFKYMDAKTGQHIRGRLNVVCTEIREECFKENKQILIDENPDWLHQVKFRLIDITTESLDNSDVQFFAAFIFFIKGESIFSMNMLEVFQNFNPDGDIISFKGNFDHDALGVLEFHGSLNKSYDIFSAYYGDKFIDQVVLNNLKRFKMPKNQIVYNNLIIIKLSEWFQTMIEEVARDKSEYGYNIIDMKIIPLRARRQNINYNNSIYFSLQSKEIPAIISRMYEIMKGAVNDVVFSELTTHSSREKYSTEINRGCWYFSLGGNHFANDVEISTATKDLEKIKRHY